MSKSRTVYSGIKNAHSSIVVMFDKILNSDSIKILKKLQEYTILKQKVIANNIANVETPGFKAKDVRFVDEFEKALKAGDIENALNVKPVVYERNDLPVRNDGNNVNIEKEMVELQKNKMRFEVYSELLRKKYKMIKEMFTDMK